ncbi:NHLP bacteriocin export ABC transporter permease/ATPase subunit [Paraliomyxa miuraensis]|uniref:NHLP bacteriocin export ABC transporter permease/ATPase subunit n=1 Tax=Paraliomyxa miuraensis TaxID=376150 RepID=UPI00224F3805|nr:NHLP bacteriocin export ABC transporter permease/ATPase subunit [Paraliomyxa miuraensis]MCX4241598.1 NHLP bacteriocin export ABC transporter permease/ATPase subunit [Paraliomyxa miuraensis]
MHDRSESPLRRIMLGEARRARVSTQAPLLLSDCDSAWYVESGRVELFWVPTRDGLPVGLRRYAGGLGEGQVLFGVPHESVGDSIGFLAVVDADTVLRRLDVSRLGELSRGDDFRDEVTAHVEHWVELLSRTPGPVASSGDVAHRAARPTDAMAWIQAALEPFHRSVMIALQERVRVEGLAERERMRLKEEAEAQRLQETLASLSDVAAARPAPAHHRDALVAAFLEISRALGQPDPPVLVPIEGAAQQDRVRHLARGLRLRVRRILLEHEWWTRDGGPMLGFLGDDQRPVALLRGRGRGYELHDPQSRTTTRLSQAHIQALQPFGYGFFRTLPGRALRRRDLLRFAFFDVRRDLSTGLVLGALIGLFGTVFPLVMGRIFDAIIPGAERGLLLQVVLLLVGLAIGSTVLGLVRSVAMIRVGTKMSIGVQAATWDRLLSLPVSFFRDYTAGDLAERATGIDRIHRALSGSVISSVFSALFGTWYLLLLFVYDVRLALVAVGLLVVPLALSLGSSLLQLRFQREAATLRGRLSGVLLQLFDGIAKIRVAGLETAAFQLWAREFRMLRQLRYRSTLLDIWVGGLRSVYPAVTTSTIFYLASVGLGERLTTGDFLAFFAAFTIFMGSLLGLLENGLVLISTIPQWERARPILAAEVEADSHKEHPGRLTGDVEVTQLSFRYTPDQPMVLDQVSFRVEAGQFVAVVGPSGCGKSTLLRLLLGFEQPVTGTVLYSGQPLSGLDVSEVRRQLGVVLQDSRVLSGSIRDNICGAHVYDEEQVWRALRRAGLEDDVEAMPMGLHTIVSHGGTSLSGGQRQRLMIARAIVDEPKILLFDEATSALDNRTQAVVSRSLESLQVTRIVIAHRLSTIQNADRILVMDRGRIVDEGRYEELLEREGPFRELARRQLT